MESESRDSIPSSFSFLSQRADSRPNSLMRASRVAFKKNSLRSAFCLGDFCTVILMYDNADVFTVQKISLLAFNKVLTPQVPRPCWPVNEPNVNGFAQSREIPWHSYLPKTIRIPVKSWPLTLKGASGKRYSGHLNRER